MTENLKLSIIIVNYNAASFLERCLISVDHFLSGSGRECCVVDNASEDGSPDLIRKRFPWVHLIANAGNLGFARAVNQGLDRSSGSYVLWLNPDTEFLDGNINELVHYLESHPEVGILGPKILNPDGSVQYSCRTFPTYANYLFGRFSLLTRWFPDNPYSRRFLKSDWDHASIRDVDWVSGACLLHRRSLIERIGKLDEGFFMYFEDVDFCLRAKAAGWQVRYHPSCRVLHHIAASSRTASSRMLIKRHQSNWRYYIKYFPRNPVKDLFIALGLVLRCAVQILASWCRWKSKNG